MTEEINSINQLIAQSKGRPIDVGAESSQIFKSVKVYNEEELAQFEAKCNLKLPQDYRNFLQIIGACEIYSDEDFHHSIEFYKLEDVYNLFSGCFEKPDEWLFKKYLPIGCDNRLQETFGFSFYFKEPEQFFVLFHEYYLEELEEEDAPEFPAYLCSLKEYINDLIKNKGKLKPH